MSVKQKRTRCGLALVLSLVFGSPVVRAETSPYIDQIKKSIGGSPEPSYSYTEEIKSRIAPPGTLSSEGYTERLKEEDPTLRFQPVTESFTELEKTRLAPKSEGGAIAATEAGKSTLAKNVKVGEIKSTMGIKYVVQASRNYGLTSGTAQSSFTSLYGDQYTPEGMVFLERQFAHSENFGSFGLLGQVGVGYFRGTGQLATELQNPITLKPFPAASKTTFTFLTFPVTAAAIYRFNLLRYVRPFILAGPTATVYLESRSDDQPMGYGISYGLYGAFGLSILLDWMSRSSEWDLYLTHGIHHSYLTVEYTRTFPVSGLVSFAASGIFIGFAFEY